MARKIPARPTPESPKEFERTFREVRNRIMHERLPVPADLSAQHLLLRADVAREAAIAGDDLGGPQWAPYELAAVDVPSLEEADAAILRRNIRRRIKSFGWSPRKLALTAGLSDSTVRHILDGRSKLGFASTATKLADVLLCTTAELTGASIFAMLPIEAITPLKRRLGQMFLLAEKWREEAEKAEKEGNVKAAQEQRMFANTIDFIDGPYEWLSTPGNHDVLRPEPELTGAPLDVVAVSHNASPRDFPIYAAAQGGPEGTQVLDWNPVEYINRPNHLIGIKDAWGVVIVDDSMSPALEHGDTALVNPRYKPERGRNHVFVRRASDGATYMLVKRLESSTDSEWKVRQFNPEKRFTLKRADWQQAFLITGKYDRR